MQNESYGRLPSVVIYLWTGLWGSLWVGLKWEAPLNELAEMNQKEKALGSMDHRLIGFLTVYKLDQASPGSLHPQWAKVKSFSLKIVVYCSNKTGGLRTIWSKEERQEVRIVWSKGEPALAPGQTTANSKPWRGENWKALGGKNEQGVSLDTEVMGVFGSQITQV